jgi:peptide-methionine (S)-S-oxide reductase
VKKIAFGGGCHWCTEAVFDSLHGISRVEQGWVNSTHKDAQSFSETVIVHFDADMIPLEILIEVHLRTHNATSNHAMREKYRSAIYTFSINQENEAKDILEIKQGLFDKPIVTKVYPFGEFKLNKDKYLNYYKNNPEKPFCKTYIEPKLKLLFERYSKFTI